MPLKNERSPALSIDFWWFFVGQLISTIGSSFTSFALPLVVFHLTHSAINLAISAVSDFAPYLLFGLIIGAFVDRLDRRLVMITTNVLSMLFIGLIPVLAFMHLLAVWHIYLIGFATSTIGIFFNAAEYAVLPSLVAKEDLVNANGRIQASYSAVSILGPALAGLLVVVMSVVNMMLIDAASFGIAALSLILIHQTFRSDSPPQHSSIRSDIVEGLQFIIHHPVIRYITMMVALFNFFLNIVGYQLVYYVKTQLNGADWEYGVLNAFSAGGIVVFGLLADKIHKQFVFSKVILTSLAIASLLIIVFGFMRSIWSAAVIWGLTWGFIILFNINVDSLRQTIVPDHLLGRVRTSARVLVWSLIPVGVLLGGFLVQWSRQTGLVFSSVGVVLFAIAVLFTFSPLAHTERYLAEEHKE